MTRIAFAGDREIATEVLRFLVDVGCPPELLLVSDPDRATHAGELRRISGLPAGRVFVGREFRETASRELLSEADLDYVIGVHFPYIVPTEVLDIPKIGVLNLHPAFLPYNRGWHTASWALLDETPIGATLHFMDDGMDTGDMIAQEELEVRPDDTADTLYRRLLALEVQLFKQAWPLLESLSPPHKAQAGSGSSHRKSELFSEPVQRLDLDSERRVRDVLRQLRALTTNRVNEAAYFEVDGVRYRVQISITPDHEPGN